MLALLIGLTATAFVSGALDAISGSHTASAHTAARVRSPEPLPGHPGNIFIAGEEIIIPAPPGEGTTWQTFNYDEKLIGEGEIQNGKAILGALPVGYYEVSRSGNKTNCVSIGVVEELRVPTPLTSPICTDAALAWLVPPERIEPVARLAALAGVNWIRDRLNWLEIEPAEDRFVSSNRYDFAVREQATQGLQILEVTHMSPAWANPKAKRFPLDLRDAFKYHREIARQWHGSVGAFEPWNEADIDAFGGHTGSEMASLQKAAYFGLKAGNPKVLACMNVFAIHRAATLEDFAANEACPYFDTFNLHHYEPFASYPRLYADFRAVSGGKPLWVTECSLPVKWSGDPRLQEPTWPDQRLQSERVAITYALALHEGARGVFFFILPHFVEGQTQFGLLRADLTPRPGYLALAAVGRLLADAQALGQLKSDKDMHGYLFRARPDGRKADVLVIWSDAPRQFGLPSPGRACFDHLGRDKGRPGGTLAIGPAPTFVIVENARLFSLVPPPAAPKPLPGKPCPIVLQALMPEKSVVLDKSAYAVQPGSRTELPLCVYNFGDRSARGRLKVMLPGGWTAELGDNIIYTVPGTRKKADCWVTAPGETNAGPATIRFTGDFGEMGEAVLSVRFLNQSAK